MFLTQNSTVYASDQVPASVKPVQPTVGNRVITDGYRGTIVKVWTPEYSINWRCIVEFDDPRIQEEQGTTVWFPNTFKDVFVIIPAPVKDHSLAANFSKWLPKNNIYTASLQTLKAELAAENAAKAVTK